MSKKNLTQERLKEVIYYNPETGFFGRYRVRNGEITNEVSPKEAGTISDNGRRVIFVDWTPYYAHRLAFLYEHGYMPELVAHEDQNPLNNKIENLSDISHQENMLNQKLPKHNASGVMGVSWRKDAGKWQVQLMVRGKTIKNGCYSNLDDAIRARQELYSRYGYHRLHGTPA